MDEATYEVIDIGREDTDAAVRVLAAALWNLPSMEFAFAGLPEAAVRRRLGRGLGSVAGAARSWGRLLGARIDGELLGAAIAFPPGTWPPSFLRWLRAGLGFLTIGPKPFFRLARYDGILNRLHPTEPHWYLYFLGVLPERQGQGIGRALFSHLAGIAATDGVPVCLETDKESNLDFYRANGCAVTGTHDLPEVGGIRLWHLRA
jgi:ribosomal protein S18 acetylase RimI-like enzyme